MIEIKGINENTIRDISRIKNEDDKMRDFRLKSYKSFLDIDEPSFGPKTDINYDNITYYKRVDDVVHDNWEDVSTDIKNIFDDLGILEAEKNYLGGVGTQFESEVIYHNMIKELVSKNVIFTDTDTALKKYPDLFYKHFNKIVKFNENKYTSLNGAVWSGGTFIYIPKDTVLDRPLQSYFRINSKDMGQFERTIIIVDDNSSLHYIEGCTATGYTTDSIHAAVVEIYVGKNAKMRYTTIQSWANNIHNRVTKRAIVSDGGLMEWIDGNIGSKTTMKYPAIILKGDNSVGKCITISVASNNQIQDTGAKMIHIGKNTKSNIISKSISSNNGITTYRGYVSIKEQAKNSFSTIKCDTILLDKDSKSYTIPKNEIFNDDSNIEHEASVYKISIEKLFYLMSRGIDEDRAREMIVMGFIDDFSNELPMEYAVELNKLLKSYINV